MSATVDQSISPQCPHPLAISSWESRGQFETFLLTLLFKDRFSILPAWSCEMHGNVPLWILSQIKNVTPCWIMQCEARGPANISNACPSALDRVYIITFIFSGSLSRLWRLAESITIGSPNTVEALIFDMTSPAYALLLQGGSDCTTMSSFHGDHQISIQWKQTTKGLI